MQVFLDFGFAYLKAISGDQRVIFPSVSGEMQTGFSLTSSNGLGITTSDGSWLFGESALEQSVMPSRSQDNSWFLSDEYRAGVLTAITELDKTSQIVNVELMVALPYRAWETISDKVVASLQGSHSVKRQKQQLVNIYFPKKFKTFPQNYAPWFAHFVTEDGKPNPPDVSRDYIEFGVFNGGGNTIEYSTVKVWPAGFRNFTKFPKGIENKSNTEEKGTFNLVSVVRSILLQEYGRDLDAHEAFQVILTGKLWIQNKEIDVSKLIESAKKQYLNSLLGICNTTWKQIDRDRMYGFIVSGGQGPVLQKFFTEMNYHNNIIMSDDPQWDVVIGMQRLRRMLG